MKRYKTVNDFIASSAEDWKPYLIKLREIINRSGLEETIKWGMPVYTHKGKNVVGLGSFKSYVGIWFFQGVLLSDPMKKLINAQDGVTQAMRQWRFQAIDEINDDLILMYVQESIANQEAGKSIKAQKKALVIFPELQEVLDSDESFSSSFENLNLTRKREYVEYVDTAKRIETKQNRLKKIIPMIQSGIGLNDKYR